MKKKDEFSEDSDMALVLRACGFKVLMHLLKFLPGIHINIPRIKTTNEDMELVEEFCGPETARSLQENLPGVFIYVPYLQENKDKAICSFVKNQSKKQTKRLAIILNLSERTIRRLNQKVKCH